VSPEVLFWFDLLFKMTLTAAVVVVASLAVERSGPFIGAIIAALPTAAGAAYIILAIEHPPGFIAASAVGTIAANAVVSVFAFAYTVLAQRHGLVLSLGSATLLWFGGAAALRLVDWTPASALALNAVVFAATVTASRRYRLSGGQREKPKAMRFDIPMRALTAAVLVVVVTTASHRIGSFVSGMFAIFPIVMGSFVVILHPRIGGPATASVLARVQAPLIGLTLGFLAVHYLAEPIGVWWSFAVGLAVSIAWNALLWFLKR